MQSMNHDLSRLSAPARGILQLLKCLSSQESCRRITAAVHVTPKDRASRSLGAGASLPATGADALDVAPCWKRRWDHAVRQSGADVGGKPLLLRVESCLEGCSDNKFEIRFRTQRPKADGRGMSRSDVVCSRLRFFPEQILYPNIWISLDLRSQQAESRVHERLQCPIWKLSIRKQVLN